MPKPSRSDLMIPLPANFIPGPSDVICAKGKKAKQHYGNCWLSHLVQSSLQKYSECASKLDRSFIVSSILNLIRQHGGFVRFVNGKGWFEIGDRNAREKIGQAFRDALHTQFRSSTKAKASIRQQREAGYASSSSLSSSGGSSCSGRRSDCSQSSPKGNYSPIPSFHSLTEVTFAPLPMSSDFSVCVTHSTTVAQEVELDLIDLEPLPISQAPAMDLSNASMVSYNCSFDQSMQVLLHSSISSEFDLSACLNNCIL